MQTQFLSAVDSIAMVTQLLSAVDSVTVCDNCFHHNNHWITLYCNTIAISSKKHCCGNTAVSGVEIALHREIMPLGIAMACAT